MQHSSRGECLPSNSVCKAYSQEVEKLLKFESSVSSILNTLKASIQALALTATTQAPSAQQAKRASISSHSHLPSNRLALEDSRLTPWRKALCQPRWHWAMKHFSNSEFNVAACTVFTTLQNYRAFANPHFRVHSANLVYVIVIACWTIWLDPPNAWRSLRYAGYIYQTVFPHVILEAIYAPDEVWGRD